MSRPVDFWLYVDVYRVGGTAFSDCQVARMVERTNSKLTATGIQVAVNSTTHIDEPSFAYVSYQVSPRQNIHRLLAYGAGPEKTLRLFLVKWDADNRYGSWTFDPLDQGLDVDLWGGAIFITELFNDNDNDRYVDMGYLPQNDTLLHEIGHVLLQEKDHYSGPHYNFLHEDSSWADDTIFPDQIAKMHGDGTAPSPYLVCA
ncbi:MAG: hypothetical protein KDA52_13350 [Planctomycetaceae bacterium]|nr:hypothetical protein [Planctomycetaceae bacterium]